MARLTDAVDYDADKASVNEGTVLGRGNECTLLICLSGQLTERPLLPNEVPACSREDEIAMATVTAPSASGFAGVSSAGGAVAELIEVRPLSSLIRVEPVSLPTGSSKWTQQGGSPACCARVLSPVCGLAELTVATLRLANNTPCRVRQEQRFPVVVCQGACKPTNFSISELYASSTKVII
ncbi:unnamed protein product [Protopolystoma xenopodis]|uniref:Uncharacterized protein n=1 Tax=Protopolystoma xenopodis TaxID=117903 RepID=A0A3S5B530_9PLAT|nr:unnamed protein product [Protopolystoma xenopodis]